jgi:hypothetical protein
MQPHPMMVVISRLQADTSQARPDAKFGSDCVSDERPVEHDSHLTARLAEDKEHLSTMDAGNRANAAELDLVLTAPHH